MAHLHRRIVLVLAALAIIGAPGAALADTSAEDRAEAKKHFDRAMELNEDGQPAAAVIELKRAYELAPHHTVLYNLGQAYITLGRPVDAVATLQRFLVEGGEAIKLPRRSEVEREIRRQRTRIATLEIRGLPDGATVTIDGEDAGKAPLVAPLRVGVGKHIVAASAAGYETAEEKIEVAGEDRKVVEMKLASRAGQSSPAAGGCPASQATIPGGTFWMGDTDLDNDSKPVHKVTLSPYCIDKTEVTVAGYRACVQSGGCPPPSPTVEWKNIKFEDRAKLSQLCTWGKLGHDLHPINCVNWKQASTYCEWAGGRLPTEAEWEYAARGNDGRNYPWGNEAPDASRLNACGGECVSMGKQWFGVAWTAMYADEDGWPATAPVGSFPKGVSPFGVFDMAGNVWEWTADSFLRYSEESVTNPRRSGPDRSAFVLRGGGWGKHDPPSVRAAFRAWEDPARRANDLGFRCARGGKP